eukprot:11057866-Lingulodinium_polyedra.AAC.1
MGRNLRVQLDPDLHLAATCRAVLADAKHGIGNREPQFGHEHLTNRRSYAGGTAELAAAPPHAKQ